MADDVNGKTWVADAALLGCSFIWASTFVVVRDSLGFADAFTFLTLRFWLATAVLVPFAWRGLKQPAVWRAGALLGLFLFGGYALQTLGLETVSPARSAFLTGMFVFAVPAVVWLTGGRRPTWPTLVGACLAVAGLRWLTGADLSELTLGDAFTLACAFVYGVHIALTERYATLGEPIALVAVQALVTAVGSTVGLVARGGHVEWRAELWVGIVITALFATAGAIAVQTWAQRRTSAMRAVVIFSIEPALALGTSVALGRETASGTQLVGAAIMVTGVLVSELGPLLRRAGATR